MKTAISSGVSMIGVSVLGGLMMSGGAYAAEVKIMNASKAAIDYANVRPLPLPQTPKSPAGLISGLTANAPASSALPKWEKGAIGNGVLSPVTLPKSAASSPAAAGSSPEAPMQAGRSSHPFTTARADAASIKVTTSYPFSAAGRLFFNINGGTYVCSASLIKRGLMVTAAHCVAGFGTNKTYAGHAFVPAYSSGSAPFGVWAASKIFVSASYLNGTSSCSVKGIVCSDDVAVIVLNPQSGTYPGTKTGWLGYGYDGAGYTNASAMITQIGYPVALDGGALMERTDSLGYVDSVNAKNTVIGSQMTGGSSGGPWMVNYGIAPTASSGAPFGNSATANMVIGVTSWGYTDVSIKEQGASPFTSANIGALVSTACTAVPAACN